MHHMMKKPTTARPARPPAIPPTRAVVFMDPEEVDVGVGDAEMVGVLPSVMPVTTWILVVGSCWGVRGYSNGDT